MVESFNSTLSSKQLQERLIQTFYEINKKEFRFEEIANPTIPECKIIFELGLAEAKNFNYIDEEELERVLNLPEKERLNTMDFFCAVRYYKENPEKKTALKFDYYMLRTIFSKKTFEIQVFHERGPRHISPEDLTRLISNKINEAAKRKVLKKANP
jgi:hypothetical protein